MFQYGFPNELRKDVLIVNELIPINTYYNANIGVSEQFAQYNQSGEIIRFPYRIYFVDVPDNMVNFLSIQQKMILHCIYSRSCNGFTRQKHLKSLLMMEYSEWTIPYIVKVCDEYVLEILDMTYNILKEQDTDKFKKFCSENVQQFCKSYARMTSYWNEFYRNKCYYFHEYIGKKLFKECFGYSRSMEKRKS